MEYEIKQGQYVLLKKSIQFGNVLFIYDWFIDEATAKVFILESIKPTPIREAKTSEK